MAASIELIEELECSICLNQYVKPKLLSCMHTFCLECISKLQKVIRPQKVQKKDVVCPQCRNLTEVFYFISHIFGTSCLYYKIKMCIFFLNIVRESIQKRALSPIQQYKNHIIT